MSASHWAADLVADWRREHYRLSPEKRDGSKYSKYLIERSLLPERRASNREDFEQVAMEMACRNVNQAEKIERIWQQKHAERFDGEETHPTTPNKDLEQMLHSESLRAAVNRERSLTDAERSVLIARLDGASFTEIASEQDSTPESIRQTMMRIRKKLC